MHQFMNTQQLLKRFAQAHRFIVWGIEAVTIAIAGIGAFVLRFDFSVPSASLGLIETGLAVWLPLKFITFASLGLDRRWSRYVSARDLFRLMIGNVVASGASFIILQTITHDFPRSVYAIDLLLCFLLTAGTRISMRLIAEFERLQSSSKKDKRTLIYGAGNGGIALLREIRRNKALEYEVCGFLDDSKSKVGRVIQDVRVLAGGDELVSIAAKFNIELILIAIPSASGPQMSAILEHCSRAGISYKTVPGLGEIMEDKSLARQIRDVAVEDLLGRSPVRLDQESISTKLRDRTVLITGAAGSIGSELCRQIARFRPAAIIGVDIAESALFHIEQELRRLFPDLRFYSEIGNIRNRQRLNEIFELYRPSVIYHAAAYKHVPMMEAHIFEAVENNVFGTLNVAVAAALHGVEDFVMISSDKAVNPTNVMGTTKRIAELVIRSLQNGGVKYVSVRFGNVLGSNGSVVPLFKDQIARGGPVTVTHPEMRRYFMTIPEACQLVLQSSTMGKGGEIFVLDMGEPVRIVDLAHKLILLSGLQPDHDIKVVFSGVRPGEKLFEELNTLDENMVPTYHEKIKIFSGTTIPWSAMEEHLATVDRLCATRELNDLAFTLKTIVPEYNPSDELLRSERQKIQPDHEYSDFTSTLARLQTATRYSTAVVGQQSQG
jgi:FlaA1/EpsC-like NDP-sugar epimerase